MTWIIISGNVYFKQLFAYTSEKL